MKELFPIFIFAAIIILRFISKAAEKRSGESANPWENDESWTPTGPTPTPPQPVRKPPTPSPRVREILEQLQEQARRSAGLPNAQSPAQPGPTTAAPRPAPRRVYIETADTPPAKTVEPAPAPVATAASLSEAQLYQENLVKAFPAAARMALKHARPTTRHLLVRLHGKKSVRRAVLLSEVLGPPRAFDV